MIYPADSDDPGRPVAPGVRPFLQSGATPARYQPQPPATVEASPSGEQA